MPNEANILEPATLIAYGRSGTSLLQNAFAAHPEFDIAGETSELIWGTFHSLERAEGIVRPQVVDGRPMPFEVRCARAVRAVFLELFQSEKKYWMQKPIGHALALDLLRGQGWSESECDAWYWRVMDAVFPGARCFTILRHPCDVVLSGRAYWGRSEAELWSGIASMAAVIVHSASRVGHAVVYEHLVREPERTLRELFAYLDIAFDPAVVHAIETVWVPRPGVLGEAQESHQARTAAGFSRRDEWSDLQPSAVRPEQLAVIRESWNRFGVELELPPRLGSS